mgnify:CR=1 FL=1
MDDFFEQRRAAHTAARQAYAAGKGTLRQTPNLTARVRLDLLCQAEKRAPTPEEVELCQDVVVVPRPGGAR